jgi:hypothetical protein
LREELWLDTLGLEELALYVKDKVHCDITLDRMEHCVTFGDVLGCVTQDQSLDKRVVLPVDKLVLPTIWLQEFRGSLKSNAEGLLDPGTGYSKEDKVFARLRRTWREYKRPFLFHWKSLTPEQQRRSLFQSAPLPLDDSDPMFPVRFKRFVFFFPLKLTTWLGFPCAAS